VVSLASSKVTLALSAATLVYGDEQAERFRVDVTSRTGATPAGDVELQSGTRTLCTLRLSAGNGSCSPARRSLAPGSYRVEARYQGSEAFRGSVSVARPLAVSKAATRGPLSIPTVSVK